MRFKHLFLFSHNKEHQHLMRRHTVIGMILGFGLAFLALYQVSSSATQQNDYWGERPAYVVEAAASGASFITNPSISPSDAILKGLNNTTLEFRKNCRISRFGQHPWLKPGLPHDEVWEEKTTEVFKVSGIPEQEIPRLIVRIKNRKFDEYMSINNRFGRSASGLVFNNKFTTTWRNKDRWVVCRDSQTNFADDEREEQAELYKVSSNSKTYYVSILIICGNVSVMELAPPDWSPDKPRPPKKETPRDPVAGFGPFPGPGGLYYGPYPEGHPGPGPNPRPNYPIWNNPHSCGPWWSPMPKPWTPGGPVNEVPEPSTIFLVILAVGLAIWISHRQKKKLTKKEEEKKE